MPEAVVCRTAHRAPAGQTIVSRMHVLFGAIIVLYAVVIVVSLYARRDTGISRHPYRNPYGDAPGAWSD